MFSFLPLSRPSFYVIQVLDLSNNLLKGDFTKCVNNMELPKLRILKLGGNRKLKGDPCAACAQSTGLEEFEANLTSCTGQLSNLEGCLALRVSLIKTCSGICLLSTDTERARGTSTKAARPEELENDDRNLAPVLIATTCALSLWCQQYCYFLSPLVPRPPCPVCCLHCACA